ncbi:sulfite exporter TauE/SafE family protein [Nocardioides sp. TRM66260-LWL]|uniref:sulfite exporter TauE/SafE family protein n=1 Tax=Nocardioides sp. TRM66260-LWL TaxID=2874478 RepID=UPI001CC3F7E7|nr:sulfite exporter TauE/SafE family protein [Nocardioides sp. TRM66260-LWL]MBZ5733930.1 sulfite exporter TauE/SafE family protein [Nocardioides sp. TRM66260-LWL]
MTPTDLGIVGALGVFAGVVNSLVGSATLVTFPVLLSLGVPPVVANVSNNIGLVPGSAVGAWGYRRELAGQGGRVLRWGAIAALGSLVGAVTLLALPPAAFEAVVPALVLLGVVLVAAGPPLSRRVAGRGRRTGEREPRWLRPAIGVTGVYGGYFGAAQGVMLIGVLGVGYSPDLQRVNAMKNALAAAINGVAGVLFALVADVEWRVAGLLALGSAVGGLLGSSVGRRLPPPLLRAAVVAVGLAAFVSILVT